ncbi:MAG: gamma-glutamyl-gamma-aminobutyrate hydrolase family protein [Clostridiales bacterium]|nr:gamma-glutamyl-gamma-aminobutyrate hydrolase family protein [Clostridiales bacterium]
MQTKHPLIALTPYYNDKKEPFMRPAYIAAIRAAGGIPVILPLGQSSEELCQIASVFDGFLFTGGPDIHAFYFGEQTQAHSGNVCLERDQMELALLPLVMAAKKPILGICRGIQLLNIALGGDIYQDIPSQFPEDFPIAHTQPFSYEIPSHTVDVLPGTLLAQIAANATRFGRTADETEASDAAPHIPLRLQVNSMHHQAIRRLGSGLSVSAYAPSQLIEAVEKPDYPAFFLGVQWHPEYLWPQDPAAAAIFTEFIKAAAVR